MKIHAPPIDEADLIGKMGMVIQAKADIACEPREDRPTLVKAGSTFRAVDRFARGWDCELITGEGPSLLRVLDGSILKNLTFVSVPEKNISPA